MKSPSFGGGRRRSSSSGLPEKMTHSRSSSNYSSSTASTSSHKSTTGSTKNPVKNAARTMADALVACFTPPETPKNSVNFSVSSDKSDASNSGGERRSGSHRGIYGSSCNSTHIGDPGSTKFTIEEIYKATKNFSPSFKIGQGGFGTVYKGRLEDGTLVAVKRAKKIVYDKPLGTEFQSEVRTLAQVEHLNLVKFHGYLEQEDERIIVVEHVPNGTLREHLDCVHGNVLDFAVRLDIAIDVAHAVTYLHMYTAHPIIHRDIKSSNILLTENLRAKVADFGFARLAADSESGETHVSTQVKGTAGYLDPEYMKTYQLTEKSDVYSFGVLLVELVTGRRPIEPKRDLKERITARWAMKKLSDGDAILTLDPRLQRSPANNFIMEKILEVALLCLAPHRRNRPPMKKCAEMLWSIRKDYKEFSTSDIPSLSSNAQRSSSIREE
ncbi:calmodulin-binding receptor-like cytoplasmic kinase 2 [Olea europaea var. sylvestris]|uniref:calmodulin-binding receptor-like cytoplasmic kinase 2 n=1 Tax=Olea europaea var. sylvestris TaxID=158386 RepID=UPI000C1CED2A|nr:calmodulin-binding receptor-like cytoplasmic kinase 2 [Olea europaea var. sylvestris]